MKRAALVIIAAAVVAAASPAIYRLLDERGWLAHTASVTVNLGPDWLAGEVRDCFSEPASNGGRPHPSVLGACFGASHSDGERTMRVTFWGSLSAPAAGTVREWRCSRRPGGLRCVAEGTVPPGIARAAYRAVAPIDWAKYLRR